MRERDLDKTLFKADAYEKPQEQIGDLYAQLHDRDLIIQRMEKELEAAGERVKRLEQAGKLALEFMQMIRESDGISLSAGREEYLLRKVLERDDIVEKYLQTLEGGNGE